MNKASSGRSADAPGHISRGWTQENTLAVAQTRVPTREEMLVLVGKSDSARNVIGLLQPFDDDTTLMS